MTFKRVLITGVSGLLGSNIAYCWKDQYDILGIYHSCEVNIPGIETIGADICDQESVNKIVDEFNPDVIVHCAAIAAPDLCKQDPLKAEAVNIGATKNIVNALDGKETKLVYVCTDLVYNGEKESYVETDPVDPINDYGKTKFLGEQEALTRENTLVLRTSFIGWDIQDRMRSLAQWFVNELSQGHKINGFTDVFFTSLYTFDWAKYCAMAIERDLRGVYHFVSSTNMSKFAFGRLLAEICGFDVSLISPLSVDDSPLKAKRAKNLNLSTSKIESALGCSLPSLEETAKAFCEDYRQGMHGKLIEFCKSNKG